VTSGRLEGKVCIITGAGGSVGAATAKVLAAAGAHLVLSDTSEAAVEQAEAICRAGGRATFFPADIGDEAEVETLVAKTVAKYGRLDGAFNNPGVEQSATPLANLSSAQWDRAIRIDLTGVFYCLKHEIRAMLKTGGGSIVNTASALGALALPSAAEYAAAKHGVAGLTKAAAAEYGPRGVRVNAVLPGIIHTPTVGRLVNDLREIGQAVALLLSDAPSFVNGVMIPVDGGYLATKVG